MDTPELMTLSETPDIIQAIQKSCLFGGEIWQAKDQIERHVLQITNVEVNLEAQSFTITAEKEIIFRKSVPVFVRLSYRSIIFKLNPKEFKIIGNTISGPLPLQIKAQEARKGDRYVLPFNAGISMSIKRMERNTHEVVFDLEVRIVDVSEYGFGIVVSGRNRHFLRKFDHFWIKAIDQKPLDYYVFGRVCYVSSKGKNKHGEVRIGLSMESPISAEIFAYLKSKSHHTLSA